MNQRELHDLPGLLAAPIPRRRAITLVAGSLLGGALGLRSRSAAAAAHVQAATFDASRISHNPGGRAGNALFGGFTRTRLTTTGAEINVVYGRADRRLATLYFHWFFLIQPEPLPERLIGGDPLFFVRRILSFSGGLDAYAPEALAEYERCFVEPATIRGLCEDYRAAASIDLEHDEVDRDRRVACPLLLLW